MYEHNPIYDALKVKLAGHNQVGALLELWQHVEGKGKKKVRTVVARVLWPEGAALPAYVDATQLRTASGDERTDLLRRIRSEGAPPELPTATPQATPQATRRTTDITLPRMALRRAGAAGYAPGHSKAATTAAAPRENLPKGVHFYDMTDGRIAVQTPYNPQFVDAIKKLKGTFGEFRTNDNKTVKVWKLDASQRPAVLQLARQYWPDEPDLVERVFRFRQYREDPADRPPTLDGLDLVMFGRDHVNLVRHPNVIEVIEDDLVSAGSVKNPKLYGTLVVRARVRPDAKAWWAPLPPEEVQAEAYTKKNPFRRRSNPVLPCPECGGAVRVRPGASRVRHGCGALLGVTA